MEKVSCDVRRSWGFSSSPVWGLNAGMNESEIGGTGRFRDGESYFQVNRMEPGIRTGVEVISNLTASQQDARSDRRSKAVFKHLLERFRYVANWLLSASVKATERISEHYNVYFY